MTMAATLREVSDKTKKTVLNGLVGHNTNHLIRYGKCMPFIALTMKTVIFCVLHQDGFWMFSW